jgi:hypothetical protein
MGIGIGLSEAFGSYAPLSYSQKVLTIAPANLIGYWQLNETSGPTAVNSEGTAARNGTYQGVTLNNSIGPDGQPVGLWDGVNDICLNTTASLISAFNDEELTMAIWVKMFNAGVWTDAANRTAFRCYTDGNNYLRMKKPTNANRFDYQTNVGGILDQRLKSGISETAWFHAALTRSIAADEVKAYYNGIQHGATLTGLGTWVGALMHANIGADGIGSNPFHGWLAHAAAWSTPLAAPQVLALATV